MNPSIALVVEDDPRIRRFVRSALESEGWQVAESTGVADALQQAAARRPSLVMLDLGLPDGDGIQFVHNFRTWSQAPVIVLSARSDESGKVAALDAGADDYLTKPFGAAEMLARVRVHVRRLEQVSRESTPQLVLGAIHIDFVNRRVTRDGVELHLTPIEYRLLSVLAANLGRVMTQRQLLHEVWGAAYVDRVHYLRVHMSNLRHKLEEDPAQPRHLLTETAVGYRLVP